MKIKDVIDVVLCLAALFSIVFVFTMISHFILFTHKDRINVIQWKEFTPYSVTKGQSGKTYQIEIGFKDDGTLVFREGKEIVGYGKSASP
jgi:hypothetical protein